MRTTSCTRREAPRRASLCAARALNATGVCVGRGGGYLAVEGGYSPGMVHKLLLSAPTAAIECGRSATVCGPSQEEIHHVRRPGSSPRGPVVRATTSSTIFANHRPLASAAARGRGLYAARSSTYDIASELAGLAIRAGSA